MRVETFSLDNGWDFNLIKHQQQFLARLDEEQPDELLMAPECRLWSRMQTLACRTPAQQEALQARRDHHHRRHLRFVRRSYLTQVKNGRRATEAPHAWEWAYTVDDENMGKPLDTCLSSTWNIGKMLFELCNDFIAIWVIQHLMPWVICLPPVVPQKQ